MRIKSVPTFLSNKIRVLQSFIYYPGINSIQSTRKQTKSKKKSTFISEQKQILELYPHYVLVYFCPACSDNLLQTIILPTNEILSRLLDSCNKITLYFNKDSILFFLSSENIQQYIISSTDVITALLFAASSNVLVIHIRISLKCIYLDVCFRESALSQPDCFPEHPISIENYKKVCDFLTFQNLGDVDYMKSKPFIYELLSETQSEFVVLLKILFDHAQSYHESNREIWDLPIVLPQNEFIITQLRSYQVDAVKWMVYREHNPIAIDSRNILDSLFLPILNEENNLYFSIYTGTFIKSLPSLAPCNIGGILADEMGLGKTLEVISLICTNPYPDWNNCGGHLKNLDDEPFNYEKKLDLDFSFSEDVLCCCGSVEETETFKLVQCEFCNGPKQHNICVQYNPQQYEHLFPIKPNYICPQCWANVSF